MNNEDTRVFTSESVTEGHPDKVCDIIADAILDEILKNDPNARVACEVTACTGLIHIMGEISTIYRIDYDQVVRKSLKEIGYDGENSGFDGEHCAVMVSVHDQSPDIAQGVNQARDQLDNKTKGAGDQGMMFGYACDETDVLMPLPIIIANLLTKQLAEVRKNKTIEYLKPDGKAQVTISYENGRPQKIKTIVVAAQHQPEISQSRIQRDIIREVVKPIISRYGYSDDLQVLVNATGRFVFGGPNADSGLTGRKIIVDTYGGFAHHGGGAFSGKDPTKVDRSGSYMARYLAKNIVAADIAKQCEVQLAYAIGIAKPVSVMVNTYGTGINPDEVIANKLQQRVDLRPQAIIERFNLQRPIYAKMASYGHFGRNDVEVPWEKIDSLDLF